MTQVTVVEAPQRWPRPRPSTFWRNRELLGFLIQRNIKVRYRQTFVGVAWSILQPLTIMIVFTIVFGRVAKIPSDGIPYPVFVLSGLLPWSYFANSVTLTSQSMLGNASLITKVYFPRILLPASTVLTPLVDFAVSLLLLFVLLPAYGVGFHLTILLLPVLFLALVLTAFSISVWLAAINVRYRDVGFVVPVLLQLWLFLTPVIYPGRLVPDGALRALYSLNPMVGIVELFRWALAGGPAPGAFLLSSGAVVLTLLTTGWVYFLRTEQTFADVI